MMKKYFIVFALLSAFVFLHCHSNNNGLPLKLGNLNLSKVIQKEEATRIINRMHGKALDVLDNLIAYYGSEGSENVLYVSVYENAGKAKTGLMNMAMKMAKGSAVFSPLTYGEMGENVLFQTEGMGHKHFFYRVDNILIWWQVEPDKAQATFNDLRNFSFSALKKPENG
jgi:hypothetical protein